MLTGGWRHEKKRRRFGRVSKLAFVLNDHYEKLLKLRDERPAVFEKLSTAARTSLIYYEAAKIEIERSAEAIG